MSDKASLNKTESDDGFLQILNFGPIGFSIIIGLFILGLYIIWDQNAGLRTLSLKIINFTLFYIVFGGLGGVIGKSLQLHMMPISSDIDSSKTKIFLTCVMQSLGMIFGLYIALGFVDSSRKNVLSTPQSSPEQVSVPSQSNTAGIEIQADNNIIDNYFIIINDYFDALDNRNLEKVLSFYAKSIDYYEAGIVDLDFIKKDKTNYFRRWPVSETKIIDKPKIEMQGNSIIIVNFNTDWMVQNNEKSVHGTASNTWIFQATEGGLKIIDEKQKVNSRIRKP